MIKKIKFNFPMPVKIRKVIEAKQEWIRKVQSGEIKIPTEKLKRFC